MRDKVNERTIPFTMGPVTGTAGPPNQTARRFSNGKGTSFNGTKGRYSRNGNFTPNVRLDTSQAELGKSIKPSKQVDAINRRLEALDVKRGR